MRSYPYDDLFEFKIGEILKHKSSPEGMGPRLLVCSRWLEQCPGGVQHHYTCASDNGGAQRYNSIELRHETGTELELVSIAVNQRVVELAKTGDAFEGLKRIFEKK